jgi:hypothetical protein
MAAKGSIAKDNLIKRFATAVGDDYIGASDDGKKFYFWSTENGEKVQVYISMTVPKTPIACGNVSNGKFEFGDSPESSVVVPQVKKEMDENEAAILARLKQELGL